MKFILVATLAVALAACAKKEEAPASSSAVEPEAPASIESEDLEAADAPQAVAAAPSEEPAMTCPVIDSRNWKAWTASDGTGMTLYVSGEVDLPTPGYAATLRFGASDRAMPPGQIVHLDLAAPDGLVAQVVTATPVAGETPGAYPEYRSLTVLCGETSLATIAPVGTGTN